MSKLCLEVGLAFLIGINFGLLVSVLVKLMTFPKCCSSVYHANGNERIVGGKKVEIESFPFAASIVVVKHNRLPKDTLQCGCCIISKKWVMSAAHCVKLLNESEVEKKYIVIISNNKQWKKGNNHPVEKMIANKYHTANTHANDTALFKVETPFTLTNEVPIMIAGVGYKYIDNKTATVIGWGYNATETKITQDTLFGVNVTIFSQEYCTDSYGELITPDMFCAGDYEGGKDACQFDSGGPIVADGVLIGIVSWGGDCGDYREPGVYARVSYFHSWLKEVESKEKEKIGYIIKN